MLWRINERNVTRALYKKRSFVSKQKKMDGVYSSSNYSDYVRWNKGIKEEEFIGALFSEEFRHHWFCGFYEKFRPAYLTTFHAELKRTIDSCVTKGYIKRSSNQNGTFLMDEVDARKLISWMYYPRLLLANKYIEYIIITILAVFIGKILLPELTSLWAIIRAFF